MNKDKDDLYACGCSVNILGYVTYDPIDALLAPNPPKKKILLMTYLSQHVTAVFDCRNSVNLFEYEAKPRILMRALFTYKRNLSRPFLSTRNCKTGCTDQLIARVINQFFEQLYGVRLLKSYPTAKLLKAKGI